MSQREKRYLVWEAVLCFALPAYHLLWGILFSPVLIAGAARGVTYMIVHLLCTLGGCLGLVALVLALRYVFEKMDRLPWAFILPAMLVGLVSIWATMTGQFTEFDLNWFSILAIGAPTACSIHILWLAVRKARGGSPNDAMHATREVAR